MLVSVGNLIRVENAHVVTFRGEHQLRVPACVHIIWGEGETYYQEGYSIIEA